MMRSLAITLLLAGASVPAWALQPKLIIHDTVVVEPRVNGKAVFLVELVGATTFPVTDFSRSIPAEYYRLTGGRRRYKSRQILIRLAVTQAKRSQGRGGDSNRFNRRAQRRRLQDLAAAGLRGRKRLNGFDAPRRRGR